MKNSGKYVPYSWKALYALLKGINDGEILSKGIIDKRDCLADIDFEVLLYDIFREVFCTPITNFPNNIIIFQDEMSDQICRPSVSTLEILTDLKTAAEKILREYGKPGIRKLQNFDIPKVDVSEECTRVIDIATQYEQYEQDPNAVFDKYKNCIYTIDGKSGSHPILAGAFTPDFVYDENLDDFVIKTERDWHIVMKESCGMSVYAFMIATMRSDDGNSADLRVIDWENYPHKDMPAI